MEVSNLPSKHIECSPCLIRKSNFYDLSFYKSFDSFLKHMLIYVEAFH